MSAELWFAIVSLAVGFIGACFSALASIIAYFVKRGEDAQDKQLDTLDKDLKRVREELAEYKAHIGAGDDRLEEIQGSIRDHVVKEEQIFWKKVDAINEAQRIFAEAVLQRMSSLEAKMPNGQMDDLVKGHQELIRGQARIEAALSIVQKDALDAKQHVIDHNKEAEDWKRRIVAVEERLPKRR